jgi:hypothetical protein
MKPIFQHILTNIRIGEPQIFSNLAVVPLFYNEETAEKFISLKTALEKGLAKINETSESGTVGTLSVQNDSEQALFLMDGEELVGAKQNRMINTSILIKAKSQVAIPVSCTEQGRWRFEARTFSDSGHIMPAKARNSKNARMEYNLRTRDSFEAGQREVWNEVASYQRNFSTHSGSSAMRDTFVQKQHELEEFVKALPIQETQQGMIVLINGVPVVGDFLIHPYNYANVHEKLIKSAALEALLEGQRTVYPIELMVEATNLISAVAKTNETYHPGVDLGENLVYEGETVSGSALVFEDEILHLNIRPKAWQNRGNRQFEENPTAPTFGPIFGPMIVEP